MLHSLMYLLRRQDFRVLLRAILILVVMTVLAFILVGQYERDRLVAVFDSRLVISSALRAEAVAEQIDRLKSDARFLSGIQTIIGLTRAIEHHGVDPEGNTSALIWKKRLASTFSDFVAENPHLAQLRFIGIADNGRELVRVERRMGKVIIVPEDELQSKADRDYFQATRQLKPGQVSISDINLNREHAQIERPFVYTMRAGAPVFGADGKLFGMVIINLNIQFLLDNLHAHSSSEFQFYLLNSNGDYLLHPDPSHTFGFDLGERWRWQDDFTALNHDNAHDNAHENTIENKSEGVMQDYSSSTGAVHAVMRKIALDTQDSKRTVSLVVAVPDAAVAQSVTTARIISLVVMLAASVLTSWVVYFYQRQRISISDKQAELAAIVENSGDAIIGETLDGFVTSWNLGAERLFGYAAHQALDRKLVNLIAPADLMSQEITLLERISRGEFISDFHTVRQSQDKRLIDVAITVSPIRSTEGRVTGASKTIRDISEQKIFEMQIQELNKSLEIQVAERTSQIRDFAALQRVILENAGFTIIACDTNGLITLFNPAAEHMLGYRAEEVIGKKTPVIWHDHDETVKRAAALSIELGEHIEPGFDVFIAKTVRGLSNEYEWTYIRKDGGRVPILLTVTALRDEHSQAFGYIGIAVDLSERQAAEQALEVNNLLLQARTAEAENANQAKSEFLANMSHEIRTPMNAILGMLQLLQQTKLERRQIDYASKAETAARTLLGILNDILDFSRVEAGKLTLDPHPFSVDILLRDVAVILSASVGNKDIEVLFEIDPSIPDWVTGDSLRLQQVLINLAGNAIKFTERGEVVLLVKRLDQEDGAVTLSFGIKDTGIGISEEQCKRIFEGFSQAEASTARRYGGSGLGLAISQRLVQMMGGSLLVESSVGQGSHFHFTLVFDCAEVPLPLTPRRLPRLQNLRCLVIDDNATARQILAEMLSSFGWTVDLASNGLDALALLNESRSTQQIHDVIFVDWRMPGMDGWETSRRIREMLPPEHAALIVMVTAHSRELLEQRQTQMPKLLDGLLVKPVTASMLFDSVADSRLNSHLNNHSGSDQTTATSDPVQQQRLAGLHLLVVDDNATNQQVANELLSNVGALVQVASGGKAAIAAIRSANPQFDAVLMDIQMPDMDGYAATREIRQILNLQALPIIAITANVMASDRVDALAAGMNDHVGKPFDLAQLIMVIQRQTGRSDAVVSAIEECEPPPMAMDSAGALMRLEGNAPLYTRLLHHFGRDMATVKIQLHAAIRDGQQEKVAALLHSLRGVAGTVGATQLAQYAKTAEEILRTQPSTDMTVTSEFEAVLNAIEPAIAAARDTLAQLSGKNKEEHPEAGYDSVQLQSTLLALQGLLQGRNMEALPLFEILKKQAGQKMSMQMTGLETALERLDFTKALQYCVELQKYVEEA